MTRQATMSQPHAEDDIVDWIVAGMEIDGFTSVNVTCKRQ
jgi:hypothetical protein